MPKTQCFQAFPFSGAEGNRTPVRTQIQCTSTVIADILTFPPDNAYQQALPFSSFIYFPSPQSFGNEVSRRSMPGILMAGRQGRQAATRQLMLNCLQRLILIRTFNVVSDHEQLLHFQ